METKIELTGMQFYAYHGVLPQETEVGNHFTVDLQLKVDVTPAVASDDLNDTLNYAEIYAIVEKEMAIPSKLIEHVAGRIVRSLAASFPSIRAITVKVSKDCPPMKGRMNGAAIVLTEEFADGESSEKLQ